MIQQDAVADILWQDVAMIARKYASAFEQMAGIKDAGNTLGNRQNMTGPGYVFLLWQRAALLRSLRMTGRFAGRDVLATLRATVLRHL
ncbi:hypothetical protein [Pararhizobium sp. PWRC1-1]|uniref:hypothetical protein n=1 Tax=Pararhizobium sp. PWRC1-1 TaxID=2804566 RepID=UPI003CEA85BB